MSTKKTLFKPLAVSKVKKAYSSLGNSWPNAYTKSYCCLLVHVGISLTPWVLTLNGRTNPLCWAFGVLSVFFLIGIWIKVWNIVAMFSLYFSLDSSPGFLSKTASKQKKCSSKNLYYRTNLMQFFLQVVPRHIRVCQQSTQGFALSWHIRVCQQSTQRVNIPCKPSGYGFPIEAFQIKALLDLR